jgi:TolB-like protein/Tfp pilus assembly protein PilF
VASIQSTEGGLRLLRNGEGTAEAHAVRAELKAILASSVFANATRLQRFLRFIVHRSLSGQAESLKEYLIGVEVFGRPPSFEPQSDSVVRVEARRLRFKLDEYYRAEGRDHQVVIEVPKGGYRPCFRFVDEPPSAERMDTSGEDSARQQAKAHLAGNPGLKLVTSNSEAQAGLAPAAGQLEGPRIPLAAGWKLTRRARILAAILLLALPLAALFFWRKVPAIKSDPITSIAVLPLATYGSNPELGYLAEDLPEAIIESLSVAPSLRVISMGSTFRLRDENRVDIARRLHVTSVLTGSVTARGNLALINLSLLDYHGQQLWSGTYEVPSDRGFDLRHQLSRDVLRALRQRTDNGSWSESASGADPKAQKAYLVGRFLWNKRDADSLRKSVAFFQEAIADDPTYAPAHAALADAYAVMAMNDQTNPRDSVLMARQSAERALALDDRLAEAHAVIAWIRFFYDWDWEGAEKEFRRALELNPNYATAHQWYGLSLIARSRFDDAIRELRVAADLDPLSLIIETDIGVAEYYARRYPLALRDAKAASELDPNFFWSHALTGAIETEQNQLPDAVAELERAYQLGGNDPDCIMRLAVAYLRMGQRNRAMPLLAQLTRESEKNHRASYQLACLYAALGDHRRALQWMQRAYANREAGPVFFNVDPLMDKVRSDPQFAQLRHYLNPAE